MTSRLGWIHFSIAAGILILASAGWNWAMIKFKWYARKEPVPWPAHVQVSETEFRNLTLTKTIGPYKIVEGDGVIQSETDGQPDGEVKYRKDVQEALHIGTSLDKTRYPERKSNWYVCRIYEDTREPAGSPYRYWQLDLTFFSGSETKVPHVPDVCILAGGSSLLSRDVLEVKDIKGVPGTWVPAPLTAIHYARSGGYNESYVQYYVFSVNGLPESSRDRVRINLSALTNRYVYYAKLQFFPMRAVMDGKAADERAEDFYRHCLPAVLKELPSAEDVKKLYEQEKQ